MKLKLTSFIAFALLFSLFLSSCTGAAGSGTESGSESTSNPESPFDNIDFTSVILDITSICSEMSTKITLDDDLYPVAESVAVNNYQIAGLYTELSAYCSSLATAECVCIAKCEDTDKAAQVKEKFESYAEKMAKTYSSYNMTESKKLENAYINSFGNYVVFFVSVDSGEAFNAFKTAVLDRVPQ